MDGYLNKLMHAESGGQLNAKNPLSTALGPFQFIDSTFLTIAKRHLADEVAGKSNAQILALRTNLALSRRAVEAFTRENAQYLEARGVEVTYPGLRLAHLLGPAGAAQALKASPETPLPRIFSSGVLRANPFMRRLTVAGLIHRAERELGLDRLPQAADNGIASAERVALRAEASDGAVEEPRLPEADVAKTEILARKSAAHRTAAGQVSKRRPTHVASRARNAGKCKAGSQACRRLAFVTKRKVRVAGS